MLTAVSRSANDGSYVKLGIVISLAQATLANKAANDGALSLGLFSVVDDWVELQGFLSEWDSQLWGALVFCLGL